MDAAMWLEELEAKRSGDKPVGMCASCGDHPPAEGFVMCVVCRAKLGLGSDEEVRAASEMVAQAENARRKRAHETFARNQKAAATATTEEVSTMKDWKYACPIEGCAKGSDTAQGLRVHVARMHREDGARAAVEARIAEVDATVNLDVIPESPEIVTHEITPLGETEPTHVITELADACPSDVEPTLVDAAGEVVDAPECDARPTKALIEDAIADGMPEPKAKTLTVNVQVQGVPAVKNLLLFQGAMIGLLCDRVVHLENARRWPLRSKQTTESVRAWAEAEVDQQKRREFRARMQAVIEDMEHKLFDLDEGAVDEDAA